LGPRSSLRLSQGCRPSDWGSAYRRAVTEPIAVTGNIFTVRSSTPETDAALLGILNSQLIRFVWQILFADFKQTFPQVTIFSLSQIPISGFDGKVLSAKAREISGAVKEIVNLYKRAVSVRTDQEGIALKRRIDCRQKGKSINRCMTFTS